MTSQLRAGAFVCEETQWRLLRVRSSAWGWEVEDVKWGFWKAVEDLTIEWFDSRLCFQLSGNKSSSSSIGRREPCRATFIQTGELCAVVL